MKFSVLVNNYNYARFLPEMMASVAGQTLPPHEIIVVDDGSEDDSLQVLETLAASTPNLKVHAQSNAGQLAAMRAGMRLATGDWCLFLDADDVWEPDHIHHAALAAALSPDAGIWFSGHRETEGPPLYRSKWPAGAIGPCAALVSATGVRIGTITSAIGIRRDIMGEILGLPASFDADWRIRADDVLLFAGAFAGAVIHYSPEPTVRYRIHGSNQFANSREDVAAYQERKSRLFETCRNIYGIDPSRHLMQLCAELGAMPTKQRSSEILRRYRRAIRRTDDPLTARAAGYFSTFLGDGASGSEGLPKKRPSTSARRSLE